MLETMLQLNWWVSTGILLLEIALLGKFISFILVSLPQGKFKHKFIDTIYKTKQEIFEIFNLDVLGERFLLFFIFIFSFIASIMTLVYSEIFLQEPCSLCWFQRVFMYGVTILSSIALITKEEYKVQIHNILVFSMFGLFFAIYQHLQQILALYGTKIPCPAGGVDCSKMTIFEYGHITFPWTAVILFAFFIVIILLQKRLKTELL